jgi:L-ascorbate metabolism protein UlaG (beta-lactamase superfamily)
MGASHMSVTERPGELLSTTTSTAGVTVTSVNHASLLLQRYGFRLLTDPWFSGTAFAGAWGLRVENPDAEELAEAATHVWISNQHADHFHPATLSALAARTPNIKVLANDSYNFSMAPRLHALGFRRVIAVPERRWVRLDDDVELLRIPSGGIDNALVIRTPDYTVLNYNDCNLPGSALRGVLRTVGRIDCLCTNYDLASKLLEPFDAHAVKDRARDGLRRTIDVVDPAAVIPFASSHYFRSAPTACQNLAFLSPDELAELSDADPRIVALRVGDSVTLSRRGQAQVSRRVPPVVELRRSIAIDRPSVEPGHVLAVASRFVKRLRRDFSGCGWFSSRSTSAFVTPESPSPSTGPVRASPLPHRTSPRTRPTSSPGSNRPSAARPSMSADRSRCADPVNPSSSAGSSCTSCPTTRFRRATP